MEWVESTGSSIDEAKERALDRLGVHGDDAEFDIISDVTTGLFGRVKEEARGRSRVAPATPRAKEERGRGRARGGKSGGGRGGSRGGGQGGDRNRSSGGNADRNDRSGSGGGEKSRASGGGNGNNGNREKQNKKSDNRDAKPRGEKREKTMSDDEATMPLPQQADLAENFVRGLAERFGIVLTCVRGIATQRAAQQIGCWR